MRTLAEQNQQKLEKIQTTKNKLHKKFPRLADPKDQKSPVRTALNSAFQRTLTKSETSLLSRPEITRKFPKNGIATPIFPENLEKILKIFSEKLEKSKTFTVKALIKNLESLSDPQKIIESIDNCPSDENLENYLKTNHFFTSETRGKIAKITKIPGTIDALTDDARREILKFLLLDQEQNPTQKVETLTKNGTWKKWKTKPTPNPVRKSEKKN